MRGALLGLLLFLGAASRAAGGTFDVRDHGARGDGAADDTARVQAAVGAAEKAGGGEVLFPAGAYRLGTIRLKSSVTLHVSAGAVLLASPSDQDFAPYENLDYESHADRETAYFHHALLAGEDLHDVAIEGHGVIDGNRSKRGGPKPIALKRCRGASIRDVTVKNAPNYAISLLGCEQVVVDGVTVLNAYSDGIDPDCCRFVRISNCFVDSWDDAICPKASLALGSRRPTEDVTVSNCNLSSSRNHFKLGTESSGDFRNIALSNCALFRFRGPGARPGIAGVAINTVDGAVIDGLVVANITMRDVDTPVFLRLGNRGRGQDPPAPGALKNVSITNVVATGARFPCAIAGLPGHPVERVSLDGVRITFRGGATQAPGLGVPEAPAEYPSARMFGDLPAYAFYCRHVEGLTLENIRVTLEAPDPRPAIVLDDARDVDLRGVKADGPAAGATQFLRVAGERCVGVRIDGKDCTGAAGPAEASPLAPVPPAPPVTPAMPVPAAPPAPPQPAPLPPQGLRPLEGAVLRYRSRLYGDEQPFAACATDLSAEPKPLIVDLIPGTLARPERAARDCEEICRIARELGRACAALRPSGRGNGSIFQGYGEVDVYEAIDALRKVVAIDPDRITVAGSSMGGAAAWYHASHSPDFWAAAAPFCGYCDYRLWEKPGGTTFHRQPWEEYSWISRDAAYRVENLRHVPVRITHGEWDRAVGGGVSVEHSRQMDRKLTQLGYPHRYIEVPKTGHGCRTPEFWKETVEWLLDQKRATDPDQVSLVVHTLRHNRSRWAAVEQQAESGKPSTVEARLSPARDRLEVRTANVARLALGPIQRAASVRLELDGASLPALDLTGRRSFARAADGSWAPTSGGIPSGEKRPGLSGPFGDIFFEPTVIVYGATGTDEESELNRLMARNAVRFFNEENGGVHRGGIHGDNAVEIPVLSDAEAIAALEPGGRPAPAGVSKELLERANLFLVGGERSNAVLRGHLGSLPVRFSEGALELCGQTFRGEHLAFYAVLPHPDGRRYVALLSGAEPDAITWGSHVGLQLLPDYLVFRRGDVVQWGFWGKGWR